jgi:hypothetical protein
MELMNTEHEYALKNGRRQDQPEGYLDTMGVAFD